MTQPISRGRLIAGWILTAIPSLMLLSGGVNSLRKAPFVLEGLVHLGYPASVLMPLALIEIGCVLLYLIPRTAFFGALLLTGFFGGAVASHVRIGEPQWPVPVVFAIITWAGLVLREPRFQPVITGGE